MFAKEATRLARIDWSSYGGQHLAKPSEEWTIQDVGQAMEGFRAGLRQFAEELALLFGHPDIPLSHSGTFTLQGDLLVENIYNIDGTPFYSAPVGAIMLWNDPDNIPAGWAIMDGIANASGTGLDMGGRAPFGWIDGDADFGTSGAAGGGTTITGSGGTVETSPEDIGHTHSHTHTLVGTATVLSVDTVDLGSHSHGATSLTVANHKHGSGTLTVASHTHGFGDLQVANHTHGLTFSTNDGTTTGADGDLAAPGPAATGNQTATLYVTSGDTGSTNPDVEFETANKTATLTGTLDVTELGSHVHNYSTEDFNEELVVGDTASVEDPDLSAHKHTVDVDTFAGTLTASVPSHLVLVFIELLPAA